MSSLRIGQKIAEHRKRKGITQEELANYLGVSKPAVSKWESEQTYPDILLLPELAAYFDISIDELVGYEPQMTMPEIRKLYQRLAEAFTKEPFEQVLKECRAYLKKYYSCWQLQMQLGLVLLNHVSLAPKKEIAEEIMNELLKLYQRLEKSSGDVALEKQAIHLQAVCFLSQQKPAEAIELLERLNESRQSSESLLVKAYQMKGDMDKALEHLQGYVFENLMCIIQAAQDFFLMYGSDSNKLKLFYGIYQELNRIFKLEDLHPALMMQLELSAVYAFAGVGDKETALNALEYCIELMDRMGTGRMALKGNEIFDVLEQYYKGIDMEAVLPRSTEAIWYDIKHFLVNNPALEGLKEEERYRNIVKRLEGSSSLQNKGLT